MTTLLAELIAYVQLDATDTARLRELGTRLAPMFPAIAARFYDAVWANPGAAAMLSGPEQVERLRVTLVDWMATGLAGPYDEAFYEKRSRIGRRHVEIGLPQHYMFTATNVVRTTYLDHIAALYEPVEALATVRAVGKLFDLELALMLRYYQLDSQDKILARERRIGSDHQAALRTLSAGLAHEVRNPLNAARLQLELLDRRMKRASDDPKLVEPAALAVQELRRLGGLLDDFLVFAQTPGIAPSAIDLATLALHVIEEEHAAATAAGARVVLDAPVGTAIIAHIDGPKVHQALQQVLRNAIEAAGAGGNVTVALSGTPSLVTLRVRDDGAGMTPAVRARMFEPFFTTKKIGTGLGLSVAHSVVTLHGGALDVSTGAGGTTVELTLPRAPALDPAGPDRRTER